MTLTLRLPLAQGSAARPLPMPDQDFGAAFADPAAPGIRSRASALALRALLLTAPLGIAALLGWASFGWFALKGPPGLGEGVVIAVTVVAFYWVALSFCSAVLGLFWRPSAEAVPVRDLDVAILLPMYGEPAAATVGAATALLAGLAAAGRHRFSLHVLSDTRDAGAAVIEEAVVMARRAAHPDLTIRYRRRAANTDYKSGNIRDWVSAEGGAHEAILILDADSVMAPAAVLRMADVLSAEPGLGLVQSPPRVLPGLTLWQRLQSFASEVYGLNLTRGFAIWAGDDANFLGHNALLRTRAFATSAGLPHLSGQAPRGGVILSHDFVEAALLRRAGWGVRMLPEADLSFEATPETLPGYLRRDRRWCQGNMQHLRLLAMPGLHPLSRFHLLQGAMAYLASVWWMVLLLLWAFTAPEGVMHDFFPGNPLMPDWPEYPALSQTALAGLVVLMLLGPKAAGIAAHVRDRGLTLAQAPAFGLSVVLEVALSILVAPVLMVHQVRAVLRTLAGFDGGWMPHAASRPTPGTLLRFHATETVLGLGLIALAAAGQLTLWLLPVAISLALAMPLSWLVQRNVRASWLLRPLPERPA
ncbi:MAG: glucans biosynthesis glucosyltransferase MdoH [Rhodobacteraceae bacterium]|jgi:membrane glycosyltransferase|nr:glucans biosynthesis glucosyltransferase MdoH [Paracoccaceae bacterium]